MRLAHSGALVRGQNNAFYLIWVRNMGYAPTRGTVTVVDTLPAGLEAIAMAGEGWSCAGNTCSRQDALADGSMFPAIVVRARVSASAPDSVSNMVTVSGGGDATILHHVANDTAEVRNNGVVTEWGAGVLSPSAPDTGQQHVVAVAAGARHALALTANGQVLAWGDDRFGQTDVPRDLTDVVAIAAGANHSLALRADGHVVAWGDNASGQSAVPQGLEHIVAIAAGGAHSLALTSNGQVVDWGAAWQRKSAADGTDAPRPKRLENTIAIAAGANFGLALHGNGAVSAWGDNTLGIVTGASTLHDVTAIAAGATHALALLEDGRITAWGDNGTGQCNVPSSANGAETIAAGADLSLALLRDGTLISWGTTAQPKSQTGIAAMAAGAQFAIAVTSAAQPSSTTSAKEAQSLAATIAMNAPRPNSANPSGPLEPVRYIVSTFAGGSDAPATNGVPALAQWVAGVIATAVDSDGNIYVVERDYNRVRKVDIKTGLMTLVAGTGAKGFAGDGADATQAQLNSPAGVALDRSGNILIADSGNNRIRRIDRVNGIITTIAGTGTIGLSGDGSTPLSATLSAPSAIAVDSKNDIYFVDGVSCIRKIQASTNTITTVAGSQDAGWGGDGGPATAARFDHPLGVAIDSADNLYIADSRNQRVRMISSSNGYVTTVAGGGSDPNVNGQVATNARLGYVQGIALDGEGNLYLIPDSNFGGTVRRLSASGILTTIAGSDNGTFGGNGILATATRFYSFAALTVNPSDGTIYASEWGARVVKLTPLPGSGSTIISSAPLGVRITVDGTPVTTPYAVDWTPGSRHRLEAETNSVVSSGTRYVFNRWSQGGAQTQTITASSTATTYLAGYATQYYLTTMSGAHGTVTPPSDWYAAGTQVTVSAQPEPGYALQSFGNALSGFLSPQVVTMTFPQTVTANFTIGVATTIDTLPSGLPIQVDGESIATPRTVYWATGSIHKLSAPELAYWASTGNARAMFQSWSQGGGAAQSITTGTQAARYTANYQPQYYLSTSTNGGGRVLPPSDWFDAGTIVDVTGVPDAGYTLATFSGALSGSANPQKVAMTQAQSVFATFSERLQPDGYLVDLVAGSFNSGFGGDGGPAIAALVANPAGVATDAAGNVYLADTNNSRIRKVNVATGVITTVAGNGTRGMSGDGGPATDAQLFAPSAIAVDAAGNLYIGDSAYDNYGLHPNVSIRVVSASTGQISTLAGNGTGTFSGDGGPATSAGLCSVAALAVDTTGAIYYSDENCSRVRKIANGTITTVAGNGKNTFSGDQGDATAATLAAPRGLVVDANGVIYIADSANNRIRKVAGGIISTVAGTDKPDFAGDAGPAVSAQLNRPLALTLDAAGNLYIGDSGNRRIRRISASSGIIDTIAGCGSCYGSVIGGRPATSTYVNSVTGLSADAAGNIYFVQFSTSVVAKLFRPANVGATLISSSPLGLDVVVDGTSIKTPYYVNWAPGSTHTLLAPRAVPIAPGIQLSWTAWNQSNDSPLQTVVASASSTVYSASYQLQYYLTATASEGGWIEPASGWYTAGTSMSFRVTAAPGYVFKGLDGFGKALNDSMTMAGPMTVNANFARIAAADQYILSTFTGNAGSGRAADGMRAQFVRFSPTGLARDAKGNILISDVAQYRIWRVDASTGLLTSIAGNGKSNYSGDGGPAVNAGLQAPTALTVDAAGNVYVVDTRRIRKIDVSSGNISTVAGNGEYYYRGDGKPALSTGFYDIAAIAIDAGGNLFVLDSSVHSVRKIDASTGIITTVAGNGTNGFGGDGEAATRAMLASPSGIAVDSTGNLYIADLGNCRVRRVDAVSGIITTVAGNGTSVSTGPNASALATAMRPSAVALDPDGNLLIAESAKGAVLRMRPASGTISTIAGGGTTYYTNGQDGGLATTYYLSMPDKFAFDTLGSIYFVDRGSSLIGKLTPVTGSGNTIITAQPLGTTVVVDGTSMTTPRALDWTPGSIHTLEAAPTMPLDANTRLIFRDWGQLGQGTTQRVTTPWGNAIYKLGYDLQFYVTTSASTGGAIKPDSAWYYSGATLNLAATAAPGYQFSGYTGLATDVNGSMVSLNVVSPMNIGATFSAVSTTGGYLDTVLPLSVGANGAATDFYGVTTSADGTLYYVSDWQSTVRRFSLTSSSTSTAAGGGTNVGGYSSGDGGPANQVYLNGASGIAIAPNGDLYIATTGRIRVVRAADGTISTYAGESNNQTSLGDGGPALTATLSSPRGLALDTAGNLFIADDNRVRKIDPTGIIVTVAGNGTAGYSGDGGDARQAQLQSPLGVAVDAQGNLFIADRGNHRVRKVTPGGIISTVAGTGIAGFDGDGGPANAAKLNTPTAVAVDTQGNLLIADKGNALVRQVNAQTGTITTINGSGSLSTWTSAPATSVALSTPTGLAVDSANHIYVVHSNGQISQLTRPGGTGSSIVTSMPPGLNVEVDGVTVTTPYAFDWSAGSTHALKATPNIATEPNARYSFSAWSQGGSASQTVTATAPGTVYGAVYKPQFYLKTSASEGGTVTPEATWYTGGASAYLSAKANAGYAFSAWTGDLTSTLTETSVTMIAPRSVAAAFVAAPPVTFTSQPAGLPITIDSDMVVTPVTRNWLPGTTHVISGLDTVSRSGGVQYRFDSWAHGGSMRQTVATPANATTYQVRYQTQYQLTTVAGVGGSISPLTGWFDAGASVNLVGRVNPGFTFQGFSGDINATTSPQTISMSGPKTVTAMFTTLQPVTIASEPAGVPLTIDGVTQTAPVTLQWIPGTQHTILADTTVAGATGVRYQFVSWDQGPGTLLTVQAPLAPARFTATFKPQYYLDTSAATGGFIAPRSAWYDGGAQVTLTATPALGYQFSAFSGAITDSSNPKTITVNAPAKVTANFETAASKLGYTIDSVAGGGPIAGVDAAATALYSPSSVKIDRAGNYIVTDNRPRVLVFGPDRKLKYNFSVGGCTQSAVGDNTGNGIYYSDGCTNQVGRIDIASGAVTIVAGSLTSTELREDVPATETALSGPRGIAVDTAGNIFVADTYSGRILKVEAATGKLVRVAGVGNTSYGGSSGDGIPATKAQLSYPYDVTVDAAGNLYIADYYNALVRKVSAASGTISTVAGTGRAGFSGDGGLATNAMLSYPAAVAVNATGDVFVSDSQNYRVRMISAASGIITTVAGIGATNDPPPNSGDGGAATSALLGFAGGISVDAQGNLYIADGSVARIRVVNATNGVITSMTGTATRIDDGPATNAQLAPMAIAMSPTGVLHVASGSRIVTVRDGITTTVAGSTEPGNSGDDGPAKDARFSRITAIAFDRAGNLYVADSYAGRVRRIAADTHTVKAAFNVCLPSGLAVSDAGDIYSSSQCRAWIYKFDAATGSVAPYAGMTASSNTLGDGGPAANALFKQIYGLAIDANNHLFAADASAQNVRMIDLTTNIVSTVAVGLRQPLGLTTDTSGNVYIADQSTGLVSMTALTNGALTAVAGADRQGFSGDGGPSTGARLRFPVGVAIDTGGNLYIADYGNGRIRKATRSADAISSVVVDSSPTGLTLVVDGTKTVTPARYAWPAGSKHTIQAAESVAGAKGVDHIFTGWAHGGAATQTITASASGALYVARYQKRYLLTTTTPGNGTLAPASGWFDAGSKVTVTATPASGYAFGGFAGDLTGMTTPAVLAMDGPRSVSATFVAAPAGATVPPQLTATLTHTGDFVAKQSGARLTATIGNLATGAPTKGNVIVSVAAYTYSLTVVSVSGPGWTCSGTTCGRSDVLAPGASYPELTIIFNVGNSTTTPSKTSAQITVSGGGTLSPIYANDSITIQPAPTASGAGATTVPTSKLNVPTGAAALPAVTARRE